MSRSRLHFPVLGYHGAHPGAEHYFKHEAHRALRRRVRMALIHGDEVLPLLREVSSVWCWPKDGKLWCWDADPKWLRK